MLQRTEGGEWEAVEGVSEARVARQVIFVETSKGRFTLHRPSSSVMPRPICSCSVWHMLSRTKETLHARPLGAGSFSLAP